MFTMGIDIGSASSKVVILKDGSDIIAAEVIQVGTGSSGPKRALEAALSKSGLKMEDMDKIVATGYGRFAIEEADKQISEISCHAKGIFFLVPTARTIIDIGGQDAKAIKLDKNGGVKQFFMNDKCAAGTGRFLDVMSRVLEVELGDMAEYDSRATEPASISSTCTVFAESEVISQLSKGVAKENIIAGVHQSVASKACGLAYRCGLEEDVVMCGGVAQNAGVVRAIEKELKKPVIVAPTPQVTGAIGAALFAYEEAIKANK
ncbi:MULTISPECIES: acyl-CoA dehydratase activase [Clostridium]|uniref:R-phenyllactate dehydratase activator n=1 Tax=Clostridium novyi (strain NT) TaxID=386415 RepID=A0Q1E1_CLONN|nr:MULTISPECIES: acyl-CoA dehydratase activase [Clostridium]ABK61888.1 R-phenyllactate dehydratase activator [Clostridium novyi NT]KEH88170.1 2-hydroxyglutaryl-CoA dehydratase [Clostridium novyi A str. NCTC 538]KEH89376.1 2-hydroxyglutaryl-CoA dehydratase [Clostridium novyi A str. 4540]KEH91299.1 2-hydroxyglutaryl-CoA dehydratase [Clostridium novyi A str. BKT29909]KEH92939.1 2-hydroxyglutaryl-CoA dehydratase [Clostridium botulinum C/D str. It1]